MRKDAAREALRRGVRWLLDLQGSDGAVCPEEGLGAYYKIPWAYAAAGHLEEATRLLHWVEHNVLTADGDFAGPVPRGPVHEDIYPYANSWLVCGAHRAGHFALSQRGMDFLERLQSPSGGFYSRLGGHDQDLMCSCMGGMAALYTGRIVRALRVARLLRNVWAAQPEPDSKLYFVWRDGQGLVTVFPPDQAAAHVLDADRDWQWYFIPGIAAGFLTSCYMAVGDDDLVKLAMDYMSFAERCGESVYRRPQGGKVGWGAALLYYVTREERFCKVAARVADYLIDSQGADGSWQNPAAGSARYLNVDVTAEFVAWLSEILRLLW